MNTPLTAMPTPCSSIDADGIVIADLRKQGMVLLSQIDRDSDALLNRRGNGAELISAVNTNIRTVAAINEVLMYYGDAGLFSLEDL